jgi:hypothetical protein
MTATETPMAGEQLPAGHELDLLIATLVLGLPVIDDGPDARDVRYVHAEQGTLPHHWIRIERYSTEIAAAWTVVEHLTPAHEPFEVLRFGGAYRARFKWVHAGTADTAPLAICRAALLAVGR